MQAKDIKRLVIKQLKANFPNWRRLTKKEKKALVEEALIEVMTDYNQEQAKHVPLHELTNMPGIYRQALSPCRRWQNLSIIIKVTFLPFSNKTVINGISTIRNSV